MLLMTIRLCAHVIIVYWRRKHLIYASYVCKCYQISNRCETNGDMVLMLISHIHMSRVSPLHK